MFAYTPYYQGSSNPYYQGSSSPYYNLDSFVRYFSEIEKQRQRELEEQSRPKIVKKVEAEDKYQIQIFKQYGDFNSYEVKAVRNARIPGLVNIVIQSVKDQFKKALQFKLEDIELEQIDWEWYKDENVLVLNIPKKQKQFCDFDLGFPAFFNLVPLDQIQAYKERQSDCKSLEKKKSTRAKKVADLKAKKLAEVRARREAERNAQREAEEQARKKAEEAEEARKQAEQARREAEQARREAEQKAIKEAEKAEKARKQEKEAQIKADKAKQDSVRKQQEEFLGLLFGQFLNAQPQLVSKTVQQGLKQPEYKEDNTTKYSVPAEEDHDISDTDSIDSEEDIATPSSPATPLLSSDSQNKEDTSLNLHKHPSLEEVEDEEFVMFRKKFGH